jgi:hypothetical protein
MFCFVYWTTRHHRDNVSTVDICPVSDSTTGAPSVSCLQFATGSKDQTIALWSIDTV